MRRTLILCSAVVGGCLLAVAAATADHGLGFGQGHGYAYPQKPHGCHHCVPEISKKTKWVYDYVCVPICIKECDRCRSLGLHRSKCGHGHCQGCAGEACETCATSCPNCTVRYIKVLVKRKVDAGCTWKCKLQEAPPVVEEVVPIPPPKVPPTMPKANGQDKKMPKANNGQPKVMPKAKIRHDRDPQQAVAVPENNQSEVAPQPYLAPLPNSPAAESQEVGVPSVPQIPSVPEFPPMNPVGYPKN